jgi:hypothetical protein
MRLRPLLVFAGQNLQDLNNFLEAIGSPRLKYGWHN